MTSPLETQFLKDRRVASLLEDLAQASRSALLALNRKIGAYPPPIPACDAQFNFLLEKRRRLSQDSRQIQRLMTRAAREGVARDDLEALQDRLVLHDGVPIDRLRAFLDEIRGDRQEDQG